MAVKGFVVAVSVLVAVLGYCLYQPIPPDYSSPWSLRVIVAKVKCGLTLIHTLHEYGIKSISDTVEEVYQKTHPIDHPDRYTDILVDDVVVYLENNITVRLYRRKQESGNPTDNGSSLLPGLVYYHGGGFVLGNPHSYDEVLIQILRATNLVIASVHYRLAPKYPFPVPLEDCVEATKYFMLFADRYGMDWKRIGVAGDSAGGNIAAAVSLRLRDQNYFARPKVQALIYPSVQKIDFKTPSYQQNANGPIVTSLIGQWFTSLYIAGDSRYVKAMSSNNHTSRAIKKYFAQSVLNHDLLPQEFLQPPYRRPSLDHGDGKLWTGIRHRIKSQDFSPLLAKSHSDLPPVFVFTAGLDILRDDGFFYVHKLRQDEVEVEHFHLPSGFHGMLNLALEHRETQELMDRLIKFLTINL